MTYLMPEDGQCGRNV